jgi:CDP-4-dehydro-6-deoxyglucose reductase, E3
MPDIEFEGRSYAYREGETVLEALVRGGARVNYSCRRGTCQTCILQLDGDVSDVTLVQALTPRARFDLGTFLACQTRATTMSVRRLDKSALFVQARLIDRELLDGDILRIRFEPPGSFMWSPGQYVNIRHPSGALRAYAITSMVFTDCWLELHVRHVPTGLMSTWLRDELGIGDFVELQGPFGDCCYRSAMADRPLIVVAQGVGTGAAVGIARDAGLRGHKRPIALYHDVQVSGHLAELMQRATHQHAKLTVTPCSTNGAPTSRRPALTTAVETAFRQTPDLANTGIFLCGAPELVRALNDLARTHGANPDNIRAAAFDPAV